jgi:hypothetical protein
MPVRTANPISRRAFMPLVATAFLSPAVIATARAQGVAWEIYRPEGLGFEVEMPGKPKIATEKFERDDPVVKSIAAEVDVDQVAYGASYAEYRDPAFLEQEVAAQQMLARALEARMRVTPFTLDGIEGRHIVMESTGLNGIVRIVVTNNRRIMLNVMGNPEIHTSATVRRFFDSFKLLPEAGPR